MEFSNYPLYCHWGGEIIQNGGDVAYRGGEQKFVFVNSGMKYDEVLNKVYEALSCDPRCVQLKVSMRYPMMPGSYAVIPLNDDNSLHAMWAVVSQTSSTAMELYIEQLPRQSQTESNLGSLPPMNTWAGVPPYMGFMNRSMAMGSFT